MCASRIETAWLFHEIGNCFLALGDFEYAKDAAKKSLEAAEEAVEWSYQLQSCVLMGVAEGSYSRSSGPARAKMCLMPCTKNKGADQPAHPRSLITPLFFAA